MEREETLVKIHRHESVCQGSGRAMKSHGWDTKCMVETGAKVYDQIQEGLACRAKAPGALLLVMNNP